MLLILRRHTVLSLLVVYQSSLWRGVEAQTTGQAPATTATSLPLLSSIPSYGQPPGTPSSSDGLPPGGISPTDGQPTFPPGGLPPGGLPPGGQPPAPLPTPGGQPPGGTLSPPGGQPPGGTLSPPGGLPPGGTLSPPGGLPPGGTLSPPGGLPPGGTLSPPGGQPPGGTLSPPGGLPPGGTQPPSLPSTDGKSPAPPGGSPLSTAASTTSASTTDAAPTAPAPDDFLISSLRWKCSPEKAPADDQIGPQWDSDIRFLIRRVFMSYNVFPKYSCNSRCGLDERDASSGVSKKDLSRCYCDKLCDDFGDCCFDFNALCRESVNPQESPLSSTETCLALKNGVTANYQGYVVWNTCPKNWTESSMRQKCQHEDEDDLLNNLPVFDNDSHITYRNIFCARCNGAINTTYWKLQFDCSEWFNTTGFNFSNIMILLQRNCSITRSPEVFQLKYLKRCIPRFQDCYNVSQEKNEPYCQTECLRYAFPLCQENSDATGDTKLRYRNPQCAICNGVKPNDLESECDSGSYPVSPSLAILFDFSSTSKYSIAVEDRDRQTYKSYEQMWSCANDEVYDPYVAKCRKIVSFGSQNAHEQNPTGPTNKSELNPNCTFVHFNKSDYEQLTNDTFFIKLHNKIYSNTSYTVGDDGLLLCVNFSRNATATTKERNGSKIKTTAASLRLLTTIGCIISMASLVFLLITYILFPELRNLPGKIIINLSFSLLLYQSVFFSAVKTSNQEQCIIVAALLHFFALCSFTWMNVMAYDVRRIFIASDGVAANQHGSYNKRLIKYCLYAWGTPALVVSVCVIIDQAVKEGSIGYGRGETECFISEPRAVLYSFVLPVALLMLFNLFALGQTVVHIVKTRKRTQQVTNQRHGTGIALICVKMASVMGVTWILGIAANIEALAFLWYPYVVLNSLQGLFIFLSFAVSGRALELYRNKVPILKYLRARIGKKNRSSSNMTIESTCPTDSQQRGPTQDSHDTRL